MAIPATSNSSEWQFLPLATPVIHHFTAARQLDFLQQGNQEVKMITTNEKPPGQLQATTSSAANRKEFGFESKRFSMPHSRLSPDDFARHDESCCTFCELEFNGTA